MRNVAFAVLLFFGGCWVKDDDPATLQELSPCGVDELDTALSSGYTLDYWLDKDSTVMITTVNPDHQRLDTITSEHWPGWAPHFLKWEFKNYIGLRHSCGSPCWSLTLMPKNPNDTIVLLMEDLAVDTNRGYVFGNRCLTEEGMDFCLFDLNNGRHHAISLPGLQWMGDITSVLDSCTFTDRGLFLRWHREVDYGSGWEPRDTLLTLPQP